MGQTVKLFSKILQIGELDYRRPRRLTSEEKKIFTKKKLSINVKCLALRYKSITHSSLAEAFEWAVKNYDRYLTYEGKHWEQRRYEPNGPYLEKEFIFRGYVPIDSFAKEPGYNYIQSNTLINGTKYIYPKKCCRFWDNPNYNKYPNPYEFHHEVGITGYTGVDVNYKL